jgi:hypothetical protein
MISWQSTPHDWPGTVTQQSKYHLLRPIAKENPRKYTHQECIICISVPMQIETRSHANLYEHTPDPMKNSPGKAAAACAAATTLASH